MASLDEINRTFLAGLQRVMEGQALMVQAFNQAMALAAPKATHLRPTFGEPVPKPQGGERWRS